MKCCLWCGKGKRKSLHKRCIEEMKRFSDLLMKKEREVQYGFRYY